MKFKKDIYIITGLFVIVVLGKIIGADFTELFAIGFIIMLYGVYISFRILKITKKKVARILARVYQILVVIFIAAFIAIETIIWSQIISSAIESKNPSNIESKYVIVLGGGIHGTKPGNILEGRLNTAIAYLNSHKDAMVICSGGQSPMEEVAESVAMKNYLVQHGISESRILQDNKSKTTIENLEYSKEILEKEGAAKDQVLIVTSSFNILRAEIIAKDFGLNAKFLGSNSKFRYNLNYSIREFGAILYNDFELIFI
ncbi:MAG: YdcF family protein [Sarcina sp.]